MTHVYFSASTVLRNDTKYYFSKTKSTGRNISSNFYICVQRGSVLLCYTTSNYTDLYHICSLFLSQLFLRACEVNSQALGGFADKVKGL